MTSFHTRFEQVPLPLHHAACTYQLIGHVTNYLEKFLIYLHVVRKVYNSIYSMFMIIVEVRDILLKEVTCSINNNIA